MRELSSEPLETLVVAWLALSHKDISAISHQVSGIEGHLLVQQTTSVVIFLEDLNSLLVCLLVLVEVQVVHLVLHGWFRGLNPSDSLVSCPDIIYNISQPVIIEISCSETHRGLQDGVTHGHVDISGYSGTPLELSFPPWWVSGLVGGAFGGSQDCSIQMLHCPCVLLLALKTFEGALHDDHFTMEIVIEFLLSLDFHAFTFQYISKIVKLGLCQRDSSSVRLSDWVVEIFRMVRALYGNLECWLLEWNAVILLHIAYNDELQVSPLCERVY